MLHWRQASSLALIAELLGRNASVCAYDPVAINEARRLLGATIEYADDPMAALNDADALVIVTEWKEFWSPDFDDMARLLRSRRIYDGRNLYDPQACARAGLIYQGIGRRSPAT